MIRELRGQPGDDRVLWEPDGRCLRRQRRPKAGQALLLLTGNGLTSTAASARIRTGALTAHRQAHAVATATHAADVLETLEGHTLLAAQVAFKGVALSGAAQLLHVGVVEVLDAGVGVDPVLARIFWAVVRPIPYT